jgi:hypothetical protein
MRADHHNKRRGQEDRETGGIADEIHSDGTFQRDNPPTLARNESSTQSSSELPWTEAQDSLNFEHQAPLPARAPPALIFSPDRICPQHTALKQTCFDCGAAALRHRGIGRGAMSDRRIAVAKSLVR